jgi:predicted house-cleaning noncanonical NTP pyrophosphatase (MazG superfamily)
MSANPLYDSQCLGVKMMGYDENKITKYNKLIRDKIPEVCNRNGKVAVIRELDEKEYEDFLLVKLREECDEFVESGSVEELADILEVMNAVFQLKGISFEEVEELRLKKREERGGFDKRLLLIETVSK